MWSWDCVSPFRVLSLRGFCGPKIASCCLFPLIIAYYLYWEMFLKFPIVFVNLFLTGLEIRAHLSGRREFVFSSKAKKEFVSRICNCYLAGKVGKSF